MKECPKICDFWWCKASHTCRGVKSAKAKHALIMRMETKHPLRYAAPERLLLENRVKRQIFVRDDYTCQYCNSKENPTIDHIIPITRGGDNSPENLQVLCSTCNEEKADKILYI